MDQTTKDLYSKRLLNLLNFLEDAHRLQAEMKKAMPPSENKPRIFFSLKEKEKKIHKKNY